MLVVGVRLHCLIQFPEVWGFTDSGCVRETGTICSLVYDIPNKKISTLLGFSKGHWEHPVEAHGDKRNPEDFERWRGLARLGTQTDRFMLSEQATILQSFKGKGDLEPIEPDAVTL